MKIVIAQPPNIKEIRKTFTINETVIFAYGDTIYNPEGIHIDRPMTIHEEVHSRQQAAIGVEVWWKKYLADPTFRCEQEKEAYRAQYRAVNITDRNKKFMYARRIALALSGPVYGNCIAYNDALKFITS